MEIPLLTFGERYKEGEGEIEKVQVLGVEEEGVAELAKFKEGVP